MFDKELVGRLYQAAGMFRPVNLGILNHSTGVTHVAGFTARQLQQRGVAIDVTLEENSAMLHDIWKMFNDTLWDHVTEGVKFLQTQGVDGRIIRLVQQHQAWKEEIIEPLTWEEKLVILGDLSFKNDIMPVKERVEDIIQRYAGPEGIPPGEEKWLRKYSSEIYQEILEIISPRILPF